MIDFKAFIRDVPDFPKPGILFKDITPLLADHEALRAALQALAAPWVGQKISHVIGIESRGFIFAPGVALALGAGFVPVRKPGKLPWKTHTIEYQLEYGSDRLEIHQDAVNPGDRVLVIDDLVATGGTVNAVAGLVKKMGGTVAGVGCVIELGFLNPRAVLDGLELRSLITY